MACNDELCRIEVRRPKEVDIPEVCSLISESTNNNSSLTPASFWADLNDFGTSATSKTQDGRVSVSPKVTNRPVVQILVALLDDRIIGYLMYSYFFSPWIRNCYFVTDIFIVEQFRRRGIATKLMERLNDLGKEEKINMIVASSERLDRSILDGLEQLGFISIRNEQTDWSVLRMNLD